MRTALPPFAILLAASIVAAAASPAPETLRVSDDGRRLTTGEGQPFFWLGDTAWELFHRLDREEATLYLETRAAQGFSVVQAVVLAELHGLSTPNAYGQLPLVDNDPTRPNEAYFEHVDFILSKANALGIVVGLLPTWGDKFNLKWGVGPEIFDTANAEAYGRFLGARYRDASIVWILGGDRIPENDEDTAIVHAMAKGLAAGDGGRHLMTYHPQGRQRSSSFFHDADWLDFNMHQSGHSDADFHNFETTLADYALEPAKPTLDGEPCYEDHPIDWKPEELGWFDAFDARRAGYWSMLSGALGHTYGHHSVWQMWQPGRHPISAARTPWQEAIHYEGAHQAGYMRRAFESVDWRKLEPAQHRLAQGPSDPAAAIRVAAARDGSLILAYAAYGSSLALRLGEQPGARAKWFNPRNGSAIPLAATLGNGETTFDPPGDESRGNDWLLIVEWD